MSAYQSVATLKRKGKKNQMWSSKVKYCHVLIRMSLNFISLNIFFFILTHFKILK